MIFKEELLHFVWKNKLFSNKNLKTVQGRNLEIINFGFHNNDAGPDFINAKIKIDDTLWAGNVEIHIKSSDWFVHNHQNDKQYNNVILHVVYEYQKEVVTENGSEVPAFILPVDEKIIEKYNLLKQNKNDISCGVNFIKTPEIILNPWIDVQLIQRLENKSSRINSILESNKGNYEETYYQVLASAFGFKVNSEPFEALAKSIPMQILAKNKDNLITLEAIFFGQAGFLESENTDQYFNKLATEYEYQKVKYKLKPLEKHLWKFLRLRPQNFPTLRIAQFAMLVHKSSGLFSKTLKTENLYELKELFNVKASEYWDTHYTFGKTGTKMVKNTGDNAVETIIINTVIPLLFIYGKNHDNQDIIDKALNFVDNMKPEVNSIIKKWLKIGFEFKTASQSQALINLHNEYCLKKRCTDCRIGTNIIKMKENFNPNNS